MRSRSARLAIALLLLGASHNSILDRTYLTVVAGTSGSASMFRAQGGATPRQRFSTCMAGVGPKGPSNKSSAAHAEEYGSDLRRLVVAGYSAGGHLALMLALLPDSVSFGDSRPGVPTPHPAAVLNPAGITDVGELLGARLGGSGR